jgi:hypothetical protein
VIAALAFLVAYFFLLVKDRDALRSERFTHGQSEALSTLSELLTILLPSE